MFGKSIIEAPVLWVRLNCAPSTKKIDKLVPSSKSVLVIFRHC